MRSCHARGCAGRLRAALPHARLLWGGRHNRRYGAARRWAHSLRGRPVARLRSLLRGHMHQRVGAMQAREVPTRLLRNPPAARRARPAAAAHRAAGTLLGHQSPAAGTRAVGAAPGAAHPACETGPVASAAARSEAASLLQVGLHMACAQARAGSMAPEPVLQRRGRCASAVTPEAAARWNGRVACKVPHCHTLRRLRTRLQDHRRH